MARFIRTISLLLCLVLLAGVVAAEEVAAEENEKHLVSVGINPFGVIWGSYKLDFGVPIMGFLEVGGQANHFRGDQFANLFGIETASDWPTKTTLGAVVRLFPAKTASGFFIGGRLMYLNVNTRDPAVDPINDMTAGIDIGWRWKWELTKAFGMFFQTHFGIQRWIFSGDIQDTLGFLALPIMPSAGLHFGIYL